MPWNARRDAGHLQQTRDFVLSRLERPSTLRRAAEEAVEYLED